MIDGQKLYFRREPPRTSSFSAKQAKTAAGAGGECAEQNPPGSSTDRLQAIVEGGQERTGQGGGPAG